jgi:uncharacterized protein YrrD
MDLGNDVQPLRSWGDLREYGIDASDGQVGSVEDIYFDDTRWDVRYLVVNTGSWLMGRRVLIPPAVLMGIDDTRRTLRLNVTQGQVRNSPPIDADRPVSRQYEEQYYQYFGWPPYWEPNPWLATGVPPEAYVPTPEQIERSQQGRHENPHLRSVEEVSGYHIEARDGAIGHVEDFLLDKQNWVVRYLEVDTRNWWPGKKVLVATGWIDRIDWAERKVFVSLSRDAIQSAPEYVHSQPVTRDYEEQLHRHYGARGYWERA